jgi:predicted dehydrogenase
MTRPSTGEAIRSAAIIGTGLIANVHRSALRTAGVAVNGVIGSRPERSAAAAQAWGVPGAIQDFDAVLRSDIRVVHICTPNAIHLSYALRAVEAGKHVIVEKPVGVSASEAEKLASAARAAGVTVTVPFIYRFHPVVREIRERRRNGVLGRVHTVHGSYLQDWLLDETATSWRVDPAQGGSSRAFADIGSHWVDLVEWVAGVRFEVVSATTAISVPERPQGAGATFSRATEPRGQARPVTTEDVAVAILRTSDVLGSVTVSQTAAGRKNRLWFEVDGSVSSAAFDQENPELAWFGAQDGYRIFTRDPGAGSAEQRRLAVLPAGHAQGYAQCFEAFVTDSYRLMSGETVDGVPTIEDGVRSARVVDAVLASAAARTWKQI